MIDSTKELDVVHTFLVDARKYGLVSEVAYFALKYMKENPESSIEDAMNYGYYEWIK
jgi:hypothetical protein